MKRAVLYATAVLVLLNLAFLLYILLGRSSDAPKGALTPPLAPRVSAAAAGQPGVYRVTGRVQELRADGSNLVVRHDAIPGFMAAMTMPFTARDPREIVALQHQDKITFRLLVTDDESWIDSVERLDSAPNPTAPAFDSERSRIVRDVEPLELGEPVPDYVLTNQFGRPVKLGDFRGKAVGLTFIFTRCPLPEFCPRMLKNFSAVAEALRGRSNSPTNWHLITVTIDPTFDTPQVLRSYAERQHYDPREWTFLTGALIDIDALTEQVGLVSRRQTPNAFPDHNLRTLVIDAQGRLKKIIVGNTWKPEEFVAEIVAAAGPLE